MIHHQFNQLSNGGASTSPKADSGNNAKDANNAAAVAISPNQKGNNSKKWRKKTTVDDAFVSQDESNPNQVSFEESESKITSSATKPATTTTPRKSKKKNGRRYKKKNWDTTNTTDNNAVSIQTYKDYTTNAEGAAILASLGSGHNHGITNHHYGLPSLVYNPESSFPIENNEGPYLNQEYYSGGSQAAVAASYYYRPNFTAEDIGTAGTNAVQQQHQMYGMPQYPVYYSYYPTMPDGTMVFYPPTQQCWDENTPLSVENHPSPPVAGQKTRLNVDAPSFQPKKI